MVLQRLRGLVPDYCRYHRGHSCHKLFQPSSTARCLLPRKNRRSGAYHQSLEQTYIWRYCPFYPFYPGYCTQQGLAIKHFLQLSPQVRSEHLYGILQHAHRKGPSSFLTLCMVGLLLRVILSLSSSLLSFGPQVTLYGIFKGLEDHSSCSQEV